MESLRLILMNATGPPWQCISAKNSHCEIGVSSAAVLANIHNAGYGCGIDYNIP